MPLTDQFPHDMFHRHPDEPFNYGDFPDLSAGVGYFRDLMGQEEWQTRREAAAWFFYRSLVGEQQDPNEFQRLHSTQDVFAWYLFLGEALTDHPHNYEVCSGCRVVPIFAAVGRSLSLIPEIDGFEERAKRLIHAEKAQPNGGLFELLVALAYARDGSQVAFKPEEPGRARTHDMDVEVDGTSWAVECKRMEIGDYGERERSRKLKLWRPASLLALTSGRSIIANIDFFVELFDVPDDYLTRQMGEFLASGGDSNSWSDEYATGTICDLDLIPLKTAMADCPVLYPGPKYNQLLTGRYIRHDSLSTIQSVKFAADPHFISDVNQAVALRTQSLSDAAIDKKARDFKRKLVDANRQLPDDRPGIIHVGMETPDTDEVEVRRFQKTTDTINSFDPAGKPLSFIYSHYFAPEAPLETAWAFDETCHVHGLGDLRAPLSQTSLVIPPSAPSRQGAHWDGTPNETFREL